MSQLRGRISIGQAATILANIGVLVGLVFVILELQQNRVSLEAEIELSLAQSYQEAMGRSLENPAVAELLSTAFTDPESLTQIQYVQLMAWNAEWMAIVYATYRLRISGAVDEDSWRQHANYFAAFLLTDWARQFWRDANSGVYPPDFLAELEAIMPTGDVVFDSSRSPDSG